MNRTETLVVGCAQPARQPLSLDEMLKKRQSEEAALAKVLTLSGRFLLACGGESLALPSHCDKPFSHVHTSTSLANL